jgi:SNF2 family DNA or RNA helicase
MRLRPSNLHGYQRRLITHQCTMPQTMLWVDMGLGKTIATLSSIAHLRAQGWLKAVLVVAPLRVCKIVWKQESAKWEHTRHLKFSTITGSRDKRLSALHSRDVDIFLINYENLKWLSEALVTYFAKPGRPLPFDGIVWDEISKMKNSTSKRVESFLKVIPHMKWITGLTGTPASNGYKDLHGQYLVLDRGMRLGESKTKFLQRYYWKQGFNLVAFSDAENTIKAKISDITLEMSAEDFNPLPDMIVNNIEIELPPDIRKLYDDLEKEFFMKLDSGEELEVFNKGSLTNKLLQFSNGSPYLEPNNPEYIPLHDLKLDALGDIVDEAQGQPVLCSYAYRSDAERIMQRFSKLKPINLTEIKSEKGLTAAMNRWKAGDCHLMIGHPASMGHGVDGLQDAGHIVVWFGLNWSLDLYKQMNARIRRQGQGIPVICHRILCKDTMDEAQAIALESKESAEDSLKKAVKEYRHNKYGV